MDWAAPKCACCCFWKRIDDARGACYRYPPAPQFNSTAQRLEFVRPETAPADFCGEFESIPIPVPPRETSRVRDNPTQEAPP